MEAINDMYHENQMLSTETNNLRTRVKALQETVEVLTQKNTMLLAEKETSGWASCKFSVTDYIWWKGPCAYMCICKCVTSLCNWFTTFTFQLVRTMIWLQLCKVILRRLKTSEQSCVRVRTSANNSESSSITEPIPLAGCLCPLYMSQCLVGCCFADCWIS